MASCDTWNFAVIKLAVIEPFTLSAVRAMSVNDSREVSRAAMERGKPNQEVRVVDPQIKKPSEKKRCFY